MRTLTHGFQTTPRALLLAVATISCGLWAPSSARAQQSGTAARPSSPSTSRMPMSRSRMSMGTTARPSGGGQSTPRPTPSGGGGSSGHQSYQSTRLYSGYALDAARWRHFGGSFFPYRIRWCSGYAPYLSRRSKESFVSITTLAAPKPARKAYKKATKEMNKREPDIDVAARHLGQALDEYPEYAAAWTLLGRVRRRAGDKPRAQEALQKSIELDPMYLEPYPQLAHMAAEKKEWGEVLRLSKAMLKINPYFPLGHYYKGSALLRQGNVKDAEKVFREGLDAPDASLFPESHYMLGEVYRTQKDVTLAAREYRLYASAARPGTARDQAVQWLSQWEELGLIESEAAKQKRKKKNKKK